MISICNAFIIDFPLTILDVITINFVISVIGFAFANLGHLLLHSLIYSRHAFSIEKFISAQLTTAPANLCIYRHDKVATAVQLDFCIFIGIRQD